MDLGWASKIVEGAFLCGWFCSSSELDCMLCPVGDLVLGDVEKFDLKFGSNMESLFPWRSGPCRAQVAEQVRAELQRVPSLGLVNRESLPRLLKQVGVKRVRPPQSSSFTVFPELGSVMCPNSVETRIQNRSTQR
eukprot:EG_transcript_34200